MAPVELAYGDIRATAINRSHVHDDFTYVVYDSGGQYLGCAYLYPMGGRTPLTGETVTYDVDVSWWVTPDGYERGYYPKAYAALRHWVETAFPFTKPYYSNAVIPDPPG
jgi:hypothetical protein